LGLRYYTMNGLTAVSFFVVPSGWNMISQKVTSGNETLFTSATLSPANGSGPQQEVNQTIRLPRATSAPKVQQQSPSSEKAPIPSARLVATGSLNDTEGIGYSVIQKPGSYSFVLVWSSPMTARNSTGQSQVFASVSVNSINQGRFNRTALVADLSESVPLAESLVSRVSGFGTSSLYIYEGQIAFGFLGEYIATLVGAALIFCVAVAGVHSDGRTEGRLDQMKDLSPEELSLLSSLSKGSPGFLAVNPMQAGWTKVMLYDTINTLLAKDLIRIRLEVHSKFASVTVSSATGTS